MRITWSEALKWFFREISPISAYTTFVLRDASRAVKKHDQWVVNKVNEKTVVAENRFTHTTAKIPRRAVTFALRRLSGVKTVDVSATLDFMVIRPFKDLSILLGEKVDVDESLAKWREYIESRRTNLVFMRRFNISAPQTINLSFYSSESFTASKLMWCFRDVPTEEAKVLSLWFNSSLNIFQVLLDRIETEGAFMSLPKYVLLNSYILNPTKLTKEQRKQLLKIYEEVSDIEFPSLTDQLEKGLPARRKIDQAILRVLGFSDEEIGGLLGYLYPALHKEIQRLKELMAG